MTELELDSKTSLEMKTLVPFIWELGWGLSFLPSRVNRSGLPWPGSCQRLSLEEVGQPVTQKAPDFA